MSLKTSSLKKVNGELFLPGMLLCSPSKRFTYIDVPKAGCTKIRQLLMFLERGESGRSDLTHFFKDVAPSPYYHWELGFGDAKELGTTTLSQTLEMEKDTFRFSFVRDPYSRLYSAWKNKIRSPNQPYYHYLSRVIKQQVASGDYANAPERLDPIYPQEGMYLRRNVPVSDPKNIDWAQAKERIMTARNSVDPLMDLYPIDESGESISFPDFIKYICRQETEEMDVHWLPMADIITNQEQFDFIGRMENFADDLTTVLTKLDAPSWLFELISKKSNDTKGVFTEWTPELRSLIFERYKQDFEQFGYASQLD